MATRSFNSRFDLLQRSDVVWLVWLVWLDNGGKANCDHQTSGRPRSVNLRPSTTLVLRSELHGGKGNVDHQTFGQSKTGTLTISFTTV